MAYAARQRVTHRNIRSNSYVQADTALESPLVTADTVNAVSALQIGGVTVGAALAGTAAPLDLPLNTAHPVAAWKDTNADSPGSSILGLTDTAGAPLLGNAASGTQKTDSALFSFSLPGWYVAGSAIKVRLRAKTTALSTVSDKVVCTFKVVADSVGSDLVTTAAQQMTTAYVNYDFTVTPTSRVAGETIQLVVTTDLNDTGGTIGGVGSITKVTILLG
jgi:hypothetical protein